MRIACLILAALLVPFALACGDDDDAPEATATSTEAAAATDTATEAPADTPEPTATATSEPPTATAEVEIAELMVTSTAFSEGEPIPPLYSCEGDNVNPDLAWTAVPDGTASIALVLRDPDAPGRTFIHWVMANLPADFTGIPENWNWAETPGVVHGIADFGVPRYGGPCPPPPNDAHRYMFEVYALDVVLDFPGGGTLADLESGMEGHILAQGVLIGTYDR